MKTEIWVLLLIAVLLIVFRKPAKKIVSKMTRGLRNNNPGNIIQSSVKFQGEKEPSTDSKFKQFKSMAYGYRAIFIILRGYIAKGFDTIEKIINRYAPPNENETTKYIDFVVLRTGIGRNQKLSFSETDKMKKIVSAISFMENGVSANNEDIEKGFELL